MLVDPNYIAKLSIAVSASSAKEQKLTSELSSGLRVATLSDDPVAASSNVLLAASISRIDAFTASASSDQSRMQVADTTLGEIVSNVTSAISLATSAGNSTLNSANLKAIAAQVQDLRDGIVSLANTAYEGNYLFSGSKGNTQPFTVDNSTSPASVTYNGDTHSQSISTPDGQTIQTNLGGSAIFQSPSGDLLASLNTLVAHLNAGDTSSITADTSAVSSALGQVTTARGQLGISLSRLESASTYGATQEAQLKASQSSLLSADTAQVATDLSTDETQHQALLNVIAGLDKTNLFSYLN